jgi:hypothetical protein
VAARSPDLNLATVRVEGRLTKTEAFTRIREILGNCDGISYKGSRHQTSEAKRQKALADLKPLEEKRKALDAEISALREVAFAYRFRLYDQTNRFIAMEIANGDTWEELIEQVRQYQARKTRASKPVSARHEVEPNEADNRADDLPF